MKNELIISEIRANMSLDVETLMLDGRPILYDVQTLINNEVESLPR